MKYLRSAIALVLVLVWFVLVTFSSLLLPQQSGPHAGPSAMTVIGLVVVLAIGVGGVVSAMGAAILSFQNQRPRAAWLLIVVALVLGPLWLLALNVDLFRCDPDGRNCAGQ